MSWCPALSSLALSVVRAPVAPVAPVPTLEIPPALAPRWAALAPSVRRYLAAYLAPAACLTADCPDRVELVAPPPVPPTFVDDLSRGGPLLRAALPDLVRTLTRIDGPAPLSIEILCEGTHDAPFFGFLLPTRRRVRFHEVHQLVLGDHLLEDRVSIDVRAIVRQLAGC